MEASPTKHEIREDPAAAGGGGGGGAVLSALRKLLDLGVFVRRRLQDVALFLFLGCSWCLGALRLIELEVLVPLLRGCSRGIGALRQLLIELDEVVLPLLFRGCSRGIGALRQLIEPEDRRLQAVGFFLTFGGCTVLNGTVPNRSVNPEHLFAGFFLSIIGAVMAILTLAGGGAGRAADRMERFLRGFF